MLDAVIKKMRLKNDAALCRELEISPPVLSKIRSNVIPLGPVQLLRLHEYTGIPTRELKAMAA